MRAARQPGIGVVGPGRDTRVHDGQFERSEVAVAVFVGGGGMRGKARQPASAM